MNYTAFGAAVTEVEIDALTGDRRILRSDIHFDCGQSLNPAVDMGQVQSSVEGKKYGSINNLVTSVMPKETLSS